MKSLSQCLIEALNTEDNRLFFDRLAIDTKNRVLCLNYGNINAEESPLINNPIEWSVDVGGEKYDVISIFRRTKYTNKENLNIDGNPFVCALKQIGGWRFDVSDDDVTRYTQRFLDVCGKINREYDVVVTVPSDANINIRFMNCIADQIRCGAKINTYFHKVEFEYAYEARNLKKIKEDCIQKYDNWKPVYEDILDEIDKCFDKMNPNGYFQSKYMNNSYMKYIDTIVSSNRYMIDVMSELIDNKNILILDDNIFPTHSISQCAQNILETFNPKTVTIITLLSSQY
ncbi:MAG: hypothetical protein RRY33_07180 [Alistipes sp.]